MWPFVAGRGTTATIALRRAKIPFTSGSVTRWHPAFAAFAAFAVALALLSALPAERCWGAWAAIGYAAAAAIMAAAPRRQAAAVVIALACATVAPLAWQAWAGLPSLAGEGPLTVVARAGGELLRHGTPYLPAARLSHVLAYDPYEPLMAAFGIPGAAGLAGWAGNPRLWLAMAAAASPLPGHLLAATGPAGKWAAVRLAVALAALFTLAPASRWGYYAYPLGVLGWALLACTRPERSRSYSSERPVATPPASPAAPAVSAGSSPASPVADSASASG